MTMRLLLFAVGLLLLVKGSDHFVKAAASLARRLGVSDFVIGLTLVALGTSVPELAAAVSAALKKESGLVLGNVIGANAANMLLITGIAALAGTVNTCREMIGRDGYIMLLVTACFALFAVNGTLGRLEAGVLLLLYLAYTLFLFTAKSGMEAGFDFKGFLNYFFRFRYVLTVRDGVVAGWRRGRAKVPRQARSGLLMDLLRLAAGGAAIAFGAEFFIAAASYFAALFAVPPLVIGASVVALGTTLPEMSVTVAAARKGFGNIAMGNVLGSCIANAGLIIGVSGLISPLGVKRAGLPLLLAMLLLSGLLLLVFIRSYWRIRKWEGALLLAAYAGFTAYLLSLAA